MTETMDESILRETRKSKKATTETTPTIATSKPAFIELTENFYINTKRKSNVKIQVKLNGDGIYLRRETEQHNHVNEQLIHLSDIIGSRCGPRLKKRARGGLSSCRTPNNDMQQQHQQQPVKDISAYLYIYAYVKQNKENLPRNRTVRILRFRSFERYENNLNSALRWHSAIRVNKRLPPMESPEQQRSLLVLLNPKSGSGKARDLFQRYAVPVLQEAEIRYDLQITTHANYAREFIHNRKDLLQQYSGIVVASGDGLLYEVVNGLMQRADWQILCRKMPLGIIPCGSGNGLAKSIAYIFNEPYETKPIMHATLNCVSGKTAPMDLVRVESFDENNKQIEMFSFLAVGWGLLADIDIESERLRSIGAPRFTLWAIHRWISLRTYRGKLHYLPWQASESKRMPVPPPPIPESSEPKPTEINSEKTQEAQSQPQPQPQPEEHFSDIPNAENNEFHDVPDEDDFFADAVSLDRESGYTNRIDSWHSALSRHTAYYSLAGQSVRSKHSITASILSKVEIANAEFEALNAPPPLKSSIPRLNEPIPDDGSWHSEEGEYILVCAAYTTHLAVDCLFIPEAKLNDGIIHLVIVRAGIGRPQLMSFLLGLSSGTHIPTTPNKYIQVIPVRAYRIEPDVSSGNADSRIMTVDGERIKYGPVQCEMFPGMLNVMVPNSGHLSSKQ